MDPTDEIEKLYAMGYSPHDIDQSLDDFGYNMDYSDMMQEEVFIGDYPFNTILEGLQKQFEDYINIEDDDNYVDIFYNQYNQSKAAIVNDEENEHQTEELEVLENIKDKFIDKIFQLFETRLTLTIKAVDDEETPDIDEQELCIRKVYEFFILNAKRNFIDVISEDISLKLLATMDEEELLTEARKMLQNYSPLITNIIPAKFIEMADDPDVYEYFNSGEIIGNFLRKYSPKLYANAELEIAIIDAVIEKHELKLNMMKIMEES